MSKKGKGRADSEGKEPLVVEDRMASISKEYAGEYDPTGGSGPHGLKPYWCGCVEEVVFRGETIKNPEHTITLGGIDFPRINETVPWATGMEMPRRTPHDGEIKMLSDKKIAKILERADKKVVQTIGGMQVVRAVEQKYFQPRPNDVPLGAFCYLVPLESEKQSYPTVEWAKPDMLVV